MQSGTHCLCCACPDSTSSEVVEFPTRDRASNEGQKGNHLVEVLFRPTVPLVCTTKMPGEPTAVLLLGWAAPLPDVDGSSGASGAALSTAALLAASTHSRTHGCSSSASAGLCSPCASSAAGVLGASFTSLPLSPAAASVRSAAGLGAAALLKMGCRECTGLGRPTPCASSMGALWDCGQLTSRCFWPVAGLPEPNLLLTVEMGANSRCERQSHTAGAVNVVVSEGRDQLLVRFCTSNETESGHQCHHLPLLFVAQNSLVFGSLSPRKLGVQK